MSAGYTQGVLCGSRAAERLCYGERELCEALRLGKTAKAIGTTFSQIMVMRFALRQAVHGANRIFSRPPVHSFFRRILRYQIGDR